MSHPCPWVIGTLIPDARRSIVSRSCPTILGRRHAVETRRAGGTGNIIGVVGLLAAGFTSVWHAVRVPDRFGGRSEFHRNNESEWSWVSVLTATGGTLAGVVVGAGSGALLVRVTGSQSPADYGPSFFACLAAAYMLGLVGCYLALRAAGYPRVVPTVAILAVVLPCSVWAVGPIVRMLAGTFDWTFGVAIPVTIVLVPLSVVLPPVAARMIAGLSSRPR